MGLSTGSMHKPLYFILFLFTASPVLKAQDKPYVYQDSTIIENRQIKESLVDTSVGEPIEPQTESIAAHTNQNPDTTIYNNQLKVSPDSIQSWKNLKGFEYAAFLDSMLKNKQDSKVEKPNVRASTGPGWLDRVFSSPATKVFFWILAGIFILFILYRLFLAESFFKKKPANFTASNPEDSADESGDDNDFDRNISLALDKGNFRLAIRYHYLKVLQSLAVKKLIEPAADKTNYQYVREMTYQPYQNDFASLTLSYEYVWYGEFNIDAKLYAKIAPGFSGFNQKIQTGN